MEELSIEERAQRYDEALERAKKWYNAPNIDKMPTYGNRIIEEIFPELIESEDERIRKEIYWFFTQPDTVCDKRWIAWLEKQGQTFTKEEVGNANKVEPKFKVGDWVVFPNGVYWHIDRIENNRYEVTSDISDTGKCADWPLDTDLYHLWTIQDAKDGDVLVDAYGNIGIYKSHDEFTWKSYCSLGCNRGFKGFEVEHENDKTHPATKEQRDTLMKEWLPQDILLILKSKYKM